MCCARIHRLVEAAEMTGADRAAAEQRRKLQFDARGKGERALAADQHMRKIDVVLARHQRVEIVAADAALNFGKARGNFLCLARADGEQVLARAGATAAGTSLRLPPMRPKCASVPSASSASIEITLSRIVP